MDYIRKYWHFIAGIAAIAALGGFYFTQGNNPVHSPERIQIPVAPIYEAEVAEPTVNIPADIVIHIEGEVYHPGVFTLPDGSRVNDAVILAGGATAYADLSRINLAAFLEDAQQIIIPNADDEIELQTTTTVTAVDSGLVNINTADESLLSTLPGIGPVIAGNIIAHRETHGQFNSIEELRNVPRIGATTLNNLRDLVTVN